VMGGEIDRMTGIIEHQLKRAAASGGALLGQAPVDLAPIASELRAALMKVYSRKDFSIELAVAPDAQFIGDKGDLTELLGNLLDNACKWGRSRVAITTATTDGSVDIIVDDDGSGLAEAMREAVLQRGVRADEAAPGSGLGLAIVRDLAEVYGGSIALEESPGGGLRARLRLL
jgi:signal transduction histidine kinase